MSSAQYADFATGRHLCSLLGSLSAAGAWNEFCQKHNVFATGRHLRSRHDCLALGTLTGTDRHLRLRLALGDFDRLVWPTIVIHKAGPTSCEYQALGCRSCFEWAPLHWQSVLNCIAVDLHWQLFWIRTLEFAPLHWQNRISLEVYRTSFQSEALAEDSRALLSQSIPCLLDELQRY